MDREAPPDEEGPSIKPLYGGAVEGLQRFPRPHLETNLLQLLKSSNGVCMFGLRRTGKSTFTRFVRDALKDYTVVEVDAQGFRTPAHLLSGIFSALPEHGLAHRLLAWVDGGGAVPATLRAGLKLAVHGLGVDDATTSATITAYWQAISDQIARSLRQDQPRILLSIDEFPWMCEGIIAREGEDRGGTAVNQLLASLRLWRAAGLKMLLTGSIGMAALERQYRLSPVHLNDMRPFSVPPLGDRDPKEPERFIRALVRGSPELSGWTQEHTATLLRESVALYPSFLQYAFLHLAHMSPLPPPEQFEEIFATDIRPGLDAPFLDQFDKRLRAYGGLGDETVDIARKLLARVVAGHPESCSRAALAEVVGKEHEDFSLAEVLKLLREDGFLLERTQRDGAQDWRLSSKLVLVWWRQRGLGARG